MIARLSVFIGLLAVFLASIGIYGLISYGVARRMNEIGIRVALGASGSHVFWMVLREGLLLASMGLALGIPVALGTGQLVSGMVFGIEPANPMNIVASAVLLTLLATLAGYLPARRAMRADPMVALRYE